MARIPGRNAWLAWPAGVLCAAIVAALVWFSLPMVPVAVAWAGETLRTATSQPTASGAGVEAVSVLERAESDDDLDCRRLYPSLLWTELAWSPRTSLQQDQAAPATSAAPLVEALAPAVRVSCHWALYNGATISTTLARVSADAPAVAEATLQAAGFRCEAGAVVLACARTDGGVVEEHAFAGELWLSSVESGAVPETYGTRLAAGIWGG